MFLLESLCTPLNRIIEDAPGLTEAVAKLAFTEDADTQRPLNCQDGPLGAKRPFDQTLMFAQCFPKVAPRTRSRRTRMRTAPAITSEANLNEQKSLIPTRPKRAEESMSGMAQSPLVARPSIMRRWLRLLTGNPDR